MQIIYISTSGEKYLRFNFQNMKARKIFACCNLAARCFIQRRVRFICHRLNLLLSKRRHKRKKAPTSLSQLKLGWDRYFTWLCHFMAILEIKGLTDRTETMRTWMRHFNPIILPVGLQQNVTPTNALQLAVDMIRWPSITAGYGWCLFSPCWQEQQQVMMFIKYFHEWLLWILNKYLTKYSQAMRK